MESNNQISSNRRPLPRFLRLASYLIVSLSSLGIVLPVVAAETVILRYQRQSISVPLQELEAFVVSGETTESLKGFLVQIPLETTRIQELMNREISDTGKRLGPNDLQFLAIQYNKVVGDPLGRPLTDPLVAALEETFADDRRVSLLELLEKYDADEVRVDLPRLDRSVQEFERFVERMEPVLEITNRLLPELVCECELQNNNQLDRSKINENPLVASTSIFQSPSVRSTDYKGITAGTDLRAIAPRRIQLPPIPGAEKITFRYGPLTVDIRVDDLNTFAETGEYPAVWNTYFGMANVSPEEFRALLGKELPVDGIELHQHLNSILGEYLLYQVSRIVHGDAENANIQVLRSSLMRSALDNERLTFLEFLQNFPLPVVFIEGLNLQRFSRNISEQRFVGTVTSGVDDMLLELQAEAADEVCECD